jgi:ankyrin repeat protein
MKFEYAQDWTPLHHATWKNHPEVIRALLDSGADLEARTQV